MKSRLTKTEQAIYDKAEWDGVNASGAKPLGDLVLILPDTASEKIGAMGILVQTDDRRESMSLASESGVIIAVGDGAFMWSRDRMKPFTGIKPKPGDRVFYRRYAGQIMIGDDGKSYRYMSDNEIGMIEEQANEASNAVTSAAA